MAFTRRFGSTGSVLIVILTLIAVVVLAPLLFLLSKTYPKNCTCNSPSSPVEELQRSTAVFVGKVIRIESPKISLSLIGLLYNSRDPMVVTFQVSKVWKGPTTRTIDV